MNELVRAERDGIAWCTAVRLAVPNSPARTEARHGRAVGRAVKPLPVPFYGTAVPFARWPALIGWPGEGPRLFGGRSRDLRSHLHYISFLLSFFLIFFFFLILSSSFFLQTSPRARHSRQSLR